MTQTILVDLRKLETYRFNLDGYNIVGFIQDYYSNQELLELCKSYPNISSVIQNNFVMFDNLGVDFYCIPYWVRFQARKFQAETNVNPITRQCFSFNINKKQINRYLLIKMVEWFNLTSFSYTWSGIGRSMDMTHIIQEWQNLNDPFTENFKAFLLNSAKLPTYFLDVTTSQPINVDYESFYGNYGDNVATWNNFIQQQNYDSAISLIAESIRYDKIAGFTEKTLYSVLGLNFPIWIGGYGQADQWHKMGFDVFDDVIDHSYQYFDTLIERIYWAFKLNLDMLSNIDYAREKRIKCLDRLIDNRRLLHNDYLTTYIEQQENQLPPELVDAILKNQYVFEELKISCYYGEFQSLSK